MLPDGGDGSYAAGVRAATAAWVAFAAVGVGAFLPWARVDFREATQGAEGFEKVVAALASALTPVVEVTAWNGRVDVGTAKVPLWTVAAGGALAAVLATLRGRGARSVPYPAAPLVALGALALTAVWTIDVGTSDGVRLLSGGWFTIVGAAALLLTLLPDPAKRA